MWRSGTRIVEVIAPVQGVKIMVKQQNIIKIKHDNELGYRWISKDKFDPNIHEKYQGKKAQSQRKSKKEVGGTGNGMDSSNTTPNKENNQDS